MDSQSAACQQRYLQMAALWNFPFARDNVALFFLFAVYMAQNRMD